MSCEQWPCATSQGSSQAACGRPPASLSDKTGHGQEVSEGEGLCSGVHPGVTRDKQDHLQPTDSARRPDGAEAAGASRPQHAARRLPPPPLPKASGGRRVAVPPRKPLVSFEAAFGLL